FVLAKPTGCAQILQALLEVADAGGIGATAIAQPPLPVVALERYLTHPEQLDGRAVERQRALVAPGIARFVDLLEQAAVDHEHARLGTACHVHAFAGRVVARTDGELERLSPPRADHRPRRLQAILGPSPGTFEHPLLIEKFERRQQLVHRRPVGAECGRLHQSPIGALLLERNGLPAARDLDRADLVALEAARYPPGIACRLFRGRA